MTTTITILDDFARTVWGPKSAKADALARSLCAESARARDAFIASGTIDDAARYLAAMTRADDAIIAASRCARMARADRFGAADACATIDRVAHG